MQVHSTGQLLLLLISSQAPRRQSSGGGRVRAECQALSRCAELSEVTPSSQLTQGQSRAVTLGPAMDKEALRLQIDNMKPQSRMERWPLSRSIQA